MKRIGKLRHEPFQSMCRQHQDDADAFQNVYGNVALFHIRINLVLILYWAYWLNYGHEVNEQKRAIMPQLSALYDTSFAQYMDCHQSVR